MKTPSVFLIGAGSAGTALALALKRSGVDVLGLHGRSAVRVRRAARRARVPGFSGPWPAALTRADVVWIAVSDDAIAEVARTLARARVLGRRQIVLHAAGAHGREVLSALAPHVRGTGSLHPLQSLADPERASQRLQGAGFAVEGSPPARAAATRLARALGAIPVPVATRGKALYHAAAAMASNGTVGVVAAAVDLMTAAGIKRADALRMLLPLLEGTLENLETLGLPAALTGPVARGDRRTIAAHRAALATTAPSLRPLYDALVAAQERLRNGDRILGRKRRK